jgi:hypothetical protein
VFETLRGWRVNRIFGEHADEECICLCLLKPFDRDGSQGPTADSHVSHSIATVLRTDFVCGYSIIYVVQKSRCLSPMETHLVLQINDIASLTRILPINQ